MHSGTARLSRECGECHRGAHGTSQHQDQLHTSTAGWEVAKMDPTATQEVHNTGTLCQLHCIHV